MTNTPDFDGPNWGDVSPDFQDEIARDMVRDRLRQHMTNIRAYLEKFDPDKLPEFDATCEDAIRSLAEHWCNPKPDQKEV